jgi:hypothetical protein
MSLTVDTVAQITSKSLQGDVNFDDETSPEIFLAMCAARRRTKVNLVLCRYVSVPELVEIPI